MWRHWMRIAEESLRSAEELRQNENLRSSASRFYYAAYQCITALLHYSGQKPPIVNVEQRESWSHEQTPAMLTDNLTFVLKTKFERRKLRKQLELLRKNRVYADYVASVEMDAITLEKQAKMSRYLVKLARIVLPKE